MKRLASTRSEKRARQPGPGRAQWSVGSIDDDGMRYGLTTHCLIARTIATAPRDPPELAKPAPPLLARSVEPTRTCRAAPAAGVAHPPKVRLAHSADFRRRRLEESARGAWPYPTYCPTRRSIASLASERPRDVS